MAIEPLVVGVTNCMDPVLLPSIWPKLLTVREYPPVGSAPFASTVRLPIPVLLMIELAPSTETVWPVTIKSVLSVLF